MARDIGQSHTVQEEQCGQYGRRPAEERGRASCPEDGCRCTAAERRPCIGPFAVLNKYKGNDAHRQQDIDPEQDAIKRGQGFLLASGFTDTQKVLGIQRGAPNQAAIDIGHAEQLTGIASFDAAAIQYARCIG